MVIRGAFVVAIAAGAATISGAAPARAQLAVHKDITYAIARMIVEGAIEACAARGYPASAVVVDRDGETIVAMRGDGAGIHTMENARRKAYTANTFKQTSDDYAKKFAEGNKTVLQQVTLPSVIAIGGGVPIKVGNEVIGAAGLSGSPGVDAECVNAGIAKVQDQLK
jgi:uncharacterized protein GlcG (DUF336 family)